MSRPDLVLASSSPTRARILSEASVVVTIEVSGAEEHLVPGTTEQNVLALAELKARAVASRRQSGLVLGCDSLLEFEGSSLGKPDDDNDAFARWRAYRGRSGVLFTGHVLIEATTGAQASEVVATTVHFGDPSDAEISAYVESGDPLSKAGAFSLEGRSAPFIRGIEGDPGNVRGLSLPALGRLVGAFGHSIVEWWEP